VATFNGIQIGLSALYAQRRATEVAGQNIANVATDGYSRQRLSVTANSGPLVPAIHSTWNGTGLGVGSLEVMRVRDAFLEGRAQREHATQSYLTRVATTYDRIELAFAEPSETGLAAQMAELWASFGDVALHPGNLAARAQLLERAATLATGFGQLDASLDSLARSSLEQLSGLVAEVNATAGRVAELNARIRSGVAAGIPTNELADQRDLLVMELASAVGATVRTRTDGTVDVFIGAMAIVRGDTLDPVEVQVTTGGTRVAWSSNPALEAKVGGEAAGLLETIGRIVPDQRAALAGVAQVLADTVNGLHTAGYDLDGNPGLDLFTFDAQGRLQLNPAMVANPRMVAASAAPGTLDGSVALQLAGQRAPEDAYREMVVALGVSAQTATRSLDVQSAITHQLERAREAHAGVSLDEEMTNLVAAQHAYDAAARYVRVVDELLDSLLRI
jgi:flagellar hook-associated protein 1 FlgK